MKYEDILHRIGGYGKYQKIIVGLLVLSSIPNGLFTMVTVFILDTPSHHCYVDFAKYNLTKLTETGRELWLDQLIPWEHNEDGELVRSQCKKYAPEFNKTSINSTNTKNRTIIPCDGGWTFYPMWAETTVVMELNWVCDDAWKKPSVISLYMAGILLGSLVSGVLSDRYGRRPVFLWGTFLQFVSMFCNGFCNNSALFTATMFMAGCTALINYVAAFVIVTEIVDSSKRALVGSLEVGGFTIGYMLLPAAAWYLTNWRWLMWFMGALGVLFIPYYWLIPESPRWLIINGKEGAKQIILKIAKTNGKSLQEEDLLSLNKVKMDKDSTDGTEEQFTYLDLFRHPSIRRRSFLMFLIWFTASMVYYCISLGTSDLGGNKFVNCFVAAAVEIPAYVSSYFLMEKFGRRTILSSYLILGGIACAAAPFFSSISESLMIASSMISKFSVTGVFSIIYIFCCEMFPTKMRNMSVGASSTMARVGAIAAPYLIFAGESVSRYIPYLVMGGFSVMAGLSTLLLPETLKVPLPETLKDSVDLDKYNIRLCKKRNAESECLHQMQETRHEEKI
uniref:solute carrier family 22 member 4-like n=1 Tax=Styela clava TaxID=7725 RepID=UPI00193A8A86|nr:solute carrier family 22 member 4-like [Styela clava]